MAPDSLPEQLVKYLTDVHAMEVQALAQMRKAPELAGDPQLASAFETHCTETERHEALIRERLQAHDATPSRIEDLLGKLSGKGFTLFAQANPDTPGKLATHAYSYEHMELAAYDLLEKVATRAGDEETAAVAREIRAEEEAMAVRIGEQWDRTVEASLKGRDAAETLDGYLADAHALETQSATLLDKGPKLVGTPGLAQILEHLEIGAYEQLTRVARLAGDGETAMVVDQILPEERAAAEFVFGAFDEALDASL